MPQTPASGDASFDFFDDDETASQRKPVDKSGSTGVSNIDEELKLAQAATGRVDPIEQKTQRVEPDSSPAAQPIPAAKAATTTSRPKGNPFSNPAPQNPNAAASTPTKPAATTPTAATPTKGSRPPGDPFSNPELRAGNAAPTQPAQAQPAPGKPAPGQPAPGQPAPTKDSRPPGDPFSNPELRAGNTPNPAQPTPTTPAIPAPAKPTTTTPTKGSRPPGDPFSNPELRAGNAAPTQPAQGHPAPTQPAQGQTSPLASDAWFGQAPAGETAAANGAPQNRKERSQEKRRQEARRREERWARTRLAVPYPTDGPKVTFGAIWFIAISASVLYSPIAVALITAFVAGLAGMQTAHAWLGKTPTFWWTASGSALIALSGLYGALGVVGGIVIVTIVLTVYAVAIAGQDRSVGELLDVLLRSSLPGGIAAGAIVALTQVELLAAVGLVLLISAYEAGDFLVGSGSRTAFEGPISGIIALSVMAFVLAMLVPEPYTVSTVIAFAAIAAIGGVAGQIFASAALPRGVAWAPALRRLDSYIIASPIWLLLVFLLVEQG